MKAYPLTLLHKPIFRCLSYEPLKNQMLQTMQALRCPLNNDLDHITETWKNFCLEYYLAVEKCSHIIILDKENKKGKKIKYKGIYISNDIEHIKKHTDIVQYPTSSNKATPFNVTFAIGYKP